MFYWNTVLMSFVISHSSNRFANPHTYKRHVKISTGVSFLLVYPPLHFRYHETKYKLESVLTCKLELHSSWPTSLILKNAIPVRRESEPAWCWGPILSRSSCSATSCRPPWTSHNHHLTQCFHAIQKMV